MPADGRFRLVSVVMATNILHKVRCKNGSMKSGADLDMRDILETRWRNMRPSGHESCAVALDPRLRWASCKDEEVHSAIGFLDTTRLERFATPGAEAGRLELRPRSPLGRRKLWLQNPSGDGAPPVLLVTRAVIHNPL